MNINKQILKFLFIVSTSLVVAACSDNSSSFLDSSSESSSSSSTSSVESSSQEQSSLSSEETKYFDETNDVFRLNISTENNVFPYDKETYISGNIEITNQAQTENVLSSKKMGIRLRGNSSLQPNKKSFKIKFDKKTSLFGLPKAKKWNLIANYYDKSNLRNYLAYSLAGNLSGLGWQVHPIFIDVYFNNEYQGLYLLTENVEVNEGRVDIENHYSKDSYPSFFLEADDRAPTEYSGYEDKAYFSVDRYNMKLAYPDPDDYIENLANLESFSSESNTSASNFIQEYEKNVSYVKTFMNDTFNALTENGDYSQLDLNSFIDYYLVQEFFKNVDIASTSQFYIVDQEEDQTVLRMGPVWDFDIAAGLIDSGSNKTYGTYIHTNLYVRKVDPFFKNLFSISKVLKILKNRYAEIREIFSKTIESISSISANLDMALERNEAKWPIDFSSLTYWIEVNAYGEKYKALTTTDGHIEYLKEYLETRLSLLDNTYF